MLNKNSKIMKSKLFFLALSAMALATSCSNDEVTELSDSNAIKYDLGIGKITRATDVYCNANPFSEFKVWAQGNSAWYIQGDEVEGTAADGTTKWTAKSGLRYWPDYNLNFYALAGYENPALTLADKSLEWTVADDVTEQKDLCYAVKAGINKETVALNFRHALSQIVFKGQNKNDKLHVEIYGVAVYNVYGKGKFTMPATSTDGNVVNHPNGEGTIGTQGEWSNPETAAGYEVIFDDPITLTTTVSNLTDNKDGNNNHTDNEYGNAMLLLPQTLTPWKLGKLDGLTEGNYNANITDGAVILVKCKIWNVAGDSFNGTTDQLLYGTEEDGRWAAMPLSTTEWGQGKKYIYTIIFDKGNGGLDPDPDGPDPDPVLVKIEYTVTIDDFVKGDNVNVDMNQEPKSDEE